MVFRLFGTFFIVYLLNLSCEARLTCFNGTAIVMGSLQMDMDPRAHMQGKDGVKLVSGCDSCTVTRSSTTVPYAYIYVSWACQVKLGDNFQARRKAANPLNDAFEAPDPKQVDDNIDDNNGELFTWDDDGNVAIPADDGIDDTDNNDNNNGGSQSSYDVCANTIMLSESSAMQQSFCNCCDDRCNVSPTCDLMPSLACDIENAGKKPPSSPNNTNTGDNIEASPKCQYMARQMALICDAVESSWS